MEKTDRACRGTAAAGTGISLFRKILTFAAEWLGGRSLDRDRAILATASTQCLLALTVIVMGCDADDSDAATFDIATSQRAKVQINERLPGDPIGLFPQSSAVSNGQFGYTIPILVPPGRAGMQPSLSLQYSSTRSHGDLGYVGWSLGGLSEISRCAKVLHRDGEVDGVQFEDDGDFCLDGQKLVPLDDPEIVLPNDLSVPAGLSPLRQYGPEDATSNLRVIAFKQSSLDRLHSWVALHPNKLYRWFGADDNSRLTARTHSDQSVETVGWLLAQEVKNYNQVDYSYIAEPTNCSPASPQNCNPDSSLGLFQAGRYLDEVTWTRWTGAPSNAYSNGSSLRRLKLNWEFPSLQPNYRDQWVKGIRLYYTGQLASVDVFGPENDHARSYELASTISERNYRRLLSEVTMCDANDVCLPPTKMTYSGVDGPEGFLVDYTARFQRTEEFTTGEFLVADLTGDGNQDLFTGGPHVLESTGTLSASTYGPGTAKVLAKGGKRLSAERVADVNLDHRSDFIHLEAGGPHDIFAFKTNTWDPGADDLVAQPGLELDDQERMGVTGTSVLIDFDGDGVLELVLFKRLNEEDDWDQRHVINVYSWVPPESSTDPDGGWKEGYKGWVPWDPNYVVIHAGGLVQDLDGNGRSELLHYTDLGYPAVGDGKLYLAADDTLTPGSIGTPLNGRYFLDINGDGLSDAVELRYPGDGTTVHSVSLNTGDGFAAASPGTPNLTLSATSDFRVADFNEDGRDDLLVLDANQGQGFAEIWLSDGKGLFGPIDMTVPLLPEFGWTDDFSTFPQWVNNRHWRGVHVLDANNDGHSEVIAISRGEQNDPDHTYLRMLAQRQSVDGVFTDLLVHVEDGLGNEQEIDYANLQDVHLPCSNLPPEDPKPDVDIDWPILGNLPQAPPKTGITTPVKCVNRGVVVEAHRRSQPDFEAREMRYAYQGARVDIQGRGYLGFEAIVERDPLLRRDSRLEFSQLPYSLGEGRFAYALVGSPWRVTTTTSDDDGEPLHVRTTSRFRRVTAAGKFRFRVSPYAETWSEELDGEQRSGLTVYDDVDAFGYSGRVTTTTAEGRTQTRRVSYEHDYDNALLGLVRRQATTFEEAGEDTVTRTAAFDYDANGSVTLQTTEPDSSDPAIRAHTSYDYWPGGLLKRVESRNIDASLVRGADTTWTSDGVFVHQTANDLGDTTTFVPDPTFGALIEVTEPNGQVSTTNIDSFGRVRSTTAPDGSSSSTVYTWQNGRFVITEKDPADVEATTALDSLLRFRESYWPTFDGETAVQSVRYDNRGRQVFESAPVIQGQPMDEGTHFFYDALGRSTEVRPPGSLGRTTLDYDGFYSVTTRQGGRSIRAVSDLDGRTLRVETLSACLTTVCSDKPPVIKTESFYYAADGSVLQHVDEEAGLAVESTYDARGRLKTRFEPNVGLETLTWNGLGDLTERTRNGLDGKTLTEVFVADALGRTVLVEATDDSELRRDRFVYGTAPGQRGYLMQTARDNDGDGVADVTDDFGYDAVGRMVAHEKHIAGESFQIEWGYDPRGRLQTIDYPHVGGQAKRVQYAYNDAGYTKALIDTQTGDVLWEGLTGDLTSFSSKKGSAIESSVVVDPLTGQLQEQVSTVGSQPVFSRSYAYHKDGRISATTDAVQSIHEQFEYDDLGRLKDWTRVGGTPLTAYTRQEFSYDPARSGALSDVRHFDADHKLTKSVAYGYVGAGPDNAVKTQATDAGYGVVTTEYAYDGFGRERSKSRGGFDRSVVRYNRFDLPEAIKINGNEHRFLYDAAGARARKVATSTGKTTVYHGSLYEKESRGGTAEHTLKLFTPDGLIGKIVYDTTDPGYKTYYFETDHRQSVEVVLDASGNEVERYYFDPFGISIDGSGQEISPNEAPIFATHTSDVESELFHMQARMFDPGKRRFTTADPIFLGFDVFAYTHNDPVNFIDPDGRCDLGPLCIFSALFGGDGFGGGSMAGNSGLYGMGPGRDAPMSGGRGGGGGSGGGGRGGGSDSPPPPQVVVSVQSSGTNKSPEEIAFEEMLAEPRYPQTPSEPPMCTAWCFDDPPTDVGTPPAAPRSTSRTRQGPTPGHMPRDLFSHIQVHGDAVGDAVLDATIFVVLSVPTSLGGVLYIIGSEMAEAAFLPEENYDPIDRYLARQPDGDLAIPPPPGNGGKSKKNSYGGGKNAKHANTKARAAAEVKWKEAKKRYEEAKTSGATKKEKKRLKAQMVHWRKKKDFTGENHSMKEKR